jgi:hypothetical protein
MEAKWKARSSTYVGILVLLGACGGDSGGKKAADDAEPTADAGGESSAMEDAGTDGTSGEDAGTDQTSCSSSQQDKDGDGVCSDACVPNTDCGSGSCNDASGTLVCVCNVGFAGDACDACATGHEGDGCKTCSDGYVLSDLRLGACIPDPCAGVECGIHGACNNVDDVAVCWCDTGWAGDACNTCDAGYEGAACDQCAQGYQAGPAGGCVADACVSKDCGSGTCSFDGVDATCACDTGWAGAVCDQCALGYLAKGDACVLELPVQNDKLVLWLDAASAKDLNATVGESVYLWGSRGTKKYIASQAEATNAPKLLSKNGVTYVHFDGTDDFMKVENVTLDQSSYSLFVAARPSKAVAGNQGVLGGVGDANPAQHGLFVRSTQSATQTQYLHRSPIALTGKGGVVTSNGYVTSGLVQPFQVITAERRPNGDGVSQILRGGTDEVSAATTQPAFGETLDFILGSRIAASERLSGDIGEIVLYNGTISTEERAPVEAYLRAKWAVKTRLVLGTK